MQSAQSKIIPRGSWCNDGVRWYEKSGVGDFGKVSRKTNEEKLGFGLIKMTTN